MEVAVLNNKYYRNLCKFSLEQEIMKASFKASNLSIKSKLIIQKHYELKEEILLWFQEKFSDVIQLTIRFKASLLW